MPRVSVARLFVHFIYFYTMCDAGVFHPLGPPMCTEPFPLDRSVRFTCRLRTWKTSVGCAGTGERLRRAGCTWCALHGRCAPKALTSWTWTTPKARRCTSRSRLSTTTPSRVWWTNSGDSPMPTWTECVNRETSAHRRGAGNRT